ncbi:hypothetical protein [Aminobacterium sp. EBM-42]|uniref:hypothetical protein n=1 Tax=Aminobacterium sp. EBM-42 TaxID=1918503 RepID=UPI0025797F95|nr:hypothetical protein [Aminobacterium sp. EBM-42]
MDIFIEQIGIEQTSERKEEIFFPVWEENKRAVFEDLSTNFLHASEKGRAALAVANTLSDEWWQKRESEEPYRLVQELYRYADERAAREARQQLERQAGVPDAAPVPAHERAVTAIPPGMGPHRPSRFSCAPRRERTASAPKPMQEQSTPTLQKPLPPISVSVPVDEATMKVLERTRENFFHPEKRAISPFPAPVVKDEKKLSPRSQEDYHRLEKQVLRELRKKRLSTGWDLVLYLIQSAREFSLSTYKRRRAVVLRLLEKKAPGAGALIQALPQYGELCRLLDKTPSRRSTAVTEARRAKQSERVFSRLLLHLPPQHQDAILALRHTGARSSEAASLRLERTPEGIRVSITSAKTGARRKKTGQTVRSWVVPECSADGAVLAGILHRRGAHPAPFSAHALRSAWHRARVKEGLNRDSGWDLHSLRHQFAGELKKNRVAELRAKYGPDWRRHLYGRDWRNSQKYIEGFYRPVADRLGHSCAAMAKIYG